MEVGTRVYPEAETVEIGDRRDNRHANPVATAQVAEHAGHRRMGRDDDVGFDPLDHPQQGARAEGDDRQLADAAAEGRALEQSVGEPINTSRVPELPVVEVVENDAQNAPDAVQRVDEHDLELSVFLLELCDDRVCSCDVALAHRRGENEYAPTAAIAPLPDGLRRSQESNERSHEPEHRDLSSDEQKTSDQ